MRTAFLGAALAAAALGLCACERDDGAATTTGSTEPAKKVEGTKPGNLVPAFAVEGTAGGAAAKIDSRAANAVTVWAVTRASCPITEAYAQRLKELETTYAAKGVKFVWLYPDAKESDEQKRAWHAAKGLGGVFVLDEDGAITKKLGATHSPQLVVTAADGTIAYHGSVDDGKTAPAKATTHHLANALDAALAGKAAPVTTSPPAG